MILDSTSILSQNQAITATAPSTGVYDTAGLGVGQPVTNIIGLPTASSGGISFGQDIGDAGPGAGGSTPQLMALITTAFASGGATTLQTQLQAATDTNNTGTPGTWDTIIETDAFAKALLLAGKFAARFDAPGRYLGQQFPRFYRLNFVVASGPFTAGAITSALLTGIDANPLYPANF
jgi:hypothetical protein